MTFSGIAVTAARGKEGSQVFSRNRGGAVTRAYVVPTDPATPDQVSWRSAWGGIASIWQLLPEDVRQMWNHAADQFYKKNVLANNYRLSGQNYFISQTINILIADGAPTFAPVDPSVILQALTVKFTTLGPSNFIVDFNVIGGYTIVPANMKLVVFGSKGVSQGINYKRTGFIGFFSLNPGDSMLGADLFSNYTGFVAPIVSGEKIFLKVRFYHQITGQVSIPIFRAGIVA